MEIEGLSLAVVTLKGLGNLFSYYFCLAGDMAPHPNHHVYRLSSPPLDTRLRSFPAMPQAPQCCPLKESRPDLLTPTSKGPGRRRLTPHKAINPVIEDERSS